MRTRGRARPSLIAREVAGFDHLTGYGQTGSGITSKQGGLACYPGKALPNVDVFLPSFEEILLMLHPERYEELSRIHQTSDLLPYANGSLLSMLSTELIQMGAAIVAIKLGEHGLYVRTAKDHDRIAAMGPCAPDMDRISSWMERELLVPCFKVKVAGTTGAGDCTIAGFWLAFSKD